MNSTGRDEKLKRKLKQDRDEAFKRRMKKLCEKQEEKKMKQKMRYHEKKDKLLTLKLNASVDETSLIKNPIRSQCKNAKSNDKIIGALKKNNPLSNSSRLPVDSMSSDSKISSSERINTSKNSNDLKKLNPPMKGIVPWINVGYKRKKVKSTVEKRAYEREKKKRQRAKVYADQELHGEFLQKQKTYYQNKKNKGSIVSISKISPRAQALQRRSWTQRQRSHRQKKREEEMSKDLVTPHKLPSYPNSCNIVQKISGAKRARKNRVLIIKENKILAIKNETLKRQALMYRKRAERSKKSKQGTGSPSPNKKVMSILKKGKLEVHRQLKFSACLTKQIKDNYKSASSQEKTALSKLVAGKILKKYRVSKGLNNVISLHRFRANRESLAS